MKRSEMVYQIARTIYDNTMRSSILETLPVAEILVRKLEELGMEPPGYMKPIPFINGKQYPLIPGDFQNDAGIWCTPGVNEWEPE